MLETRYIELSEKIADDIRHGLWTERLPGVIKLGKALKADPATVLKALKVLEDKNIVTINGKKGTFITQPGEKPKHHVIGLVGIPTEDVLQRYSSEFAAIEKVAGKADFRVIGISHNNQLFVNDMELLLQFPVDGYVFMYSSLTTEIASFLKRKGMKFVACNDTVGIPGVSWIDFDSAFVFRTGFEYLIELGHKKIAYLEFFNPNYNYSGRIRSVYKEMSAANDMSFNESFFISKSVAPYYKLHGEAYQYAFGYECAKSLCGKSGAPTAVMATTRKMGQGFCDGAAKHGFNVPDDISVLTYADCTEKEDFLSCVTMDYERRVEIATEMLIDLIENDSAEIRHELLVPELIARQSTSKCRG